jgi:hypothetical protein
MPGLGHFPMCENPDLFRTYLMPVLAEIEDSVVMARAESDLKPRDRLPREGGQQG